MCVATILRVAQVWHWQSENLLHLEYKIDQETSVLKRQPKIKHISNSIFFWQTSAFDCAEIMSNSRSRDSKNKKLYLSRIWFEG